MKRLILTILLLIIPATTWGFSFQSKPVEIPIRDALRPSIFDVEREKVHLLRDVVEVHQFATQHTPTQTPVPASAWLLASGLIGIFAWTRRVK